MAPASFDPKNLPPELRRIVNKAPAELERAQLEKKVIDAGPLPVKPEDTAKAEDSFASAPAEPAHGLMVPVVEGRLAPGSQAASGLAHLSLRLPGGKTALVPVWKRQSIDFATRRAQQQNFAGANRVSSGEARRGLEQHLKPLRQELEGMKALRALHSKVAALHAVDVWGELRLALNLDQVQTRLMSELVAAADPRKGLQRVAEALAKGGLEEPVLSIQDLNRVLPEITQYELGVVALLESVPRTLLHRPHTAVAMLRDLSMDGATFASDDQVLEAMEVGSDLMGFTGVRENEEAIPFTPAVRTTFNKLLRLGLRDAMLFEQAIERNGNAALGRGYAMIQEAGDVNLAANVQNLVTGKLYDAVSLGELVGMLEQVPDVLRQPDPFHGFVVPYGAGLKLVDLNGTTREYVALHTFMQGMAHEDIHYLSKVDIRAKNPLVTALAQQLCRAVQDRIFQNMDGLSDLEQLGVEAMSDLGVSLPVAARKFFREYGVGESEEAPLGSAHTDAVLFTLKMGPEELHELMEIIRSLPPEVRSELFPRAIKRVVKRQSIEGAAREGARRNLLFGQYDPFSRALIVYDYPDMMGTFQELPPHSRQLRRDTIAHELGEAVYHALSAERQSAWQAISGWTRDLVGAGTARFGVEEERQANAVKPDQLGQHFLTTYSQNAENDDFSECFTAYLHHGDEFRKQAGAAGAQPLADKYAFIRRELKGVEYAQRSPFSLQELGGVLELIAQRGSVEQVIEQRYRHEADQLENLYTHAGEDVVSIEQLREQDASDIDDARGPRRKRSGQPPAVAFDLPDALLRTLPGNKKVVKLSARTIGEAFDALFEQHPGLKDRLFQDGALRDNYRLTLNGHPVEPEQMNDKLRRGETLRIK